MCSCDPGDPPTKLYCFDATSLFKPAAGALATVIEVGSTGKLKASAEVSKVEACIQTCCNDDHTTGLQFQVSASAKAEVSLVGGFNQSFSPKGVKLTLPNIGEVSADVKFEVLLGAVAKATAPISLTYTKGCKKDCLEGSAGINISLTAGAQATATATLKAKNLLTGEETVVGEAKMVFGGSISSGAGGSFQYKCGEGWKGDLCFQGVWVEGGLGSVHYKLLSGEEGDVGGPSLPKTYLVCPVGTGTECTTPPECVGSRRPQDNLLYLNSKENLFKELETIRLSLDKVKYPKYILKSHPVSHGK